MKVEAIHPVHLCHKCWFTTWIRRYFDTYFDKPVDLEARAFFDMYIARCWEHGIPIPIPCEHCLVMIYFGHTW